MLRTIMAAALVISCGGPDSAPPPAEAGGAGSGASSSHGGSSSAGRGGSGGASSVSGRAGSGGKGGPTCAERWAEYEPLILPSRRCDPNAATPECDFTVVVFDRCGCSVPANKSSSEYRLANRRSVDYANACEFPDHCAGCPSTVRAGCADPGDGVFVCVYQ